MRPGRVAMLIEYEFGAAAGGATANQRLPESPGMGLSRRSLHPELLGIKRLGALLILHEDAHGTNVRDHILTFFSCICQFAQGSKIQDADLLPIVFEDAARGPLLQFPTHHERLQRSRASEGGEREREITQRAPIAAK